MQLQLVHHKIINDVWQNYYYAIFAFRSPFQRIRMLNFLSFLYHFAMNGTKSDLQPFQLN